MQLTQTQRAAVRAVVLATPAAKAFLGAGDTYSLREWLNAPKSPAVMAWRTSVPAAELRNAPTTTAVSYTLYDSMSVGQRASWELFLSAPVDMTQPGVRAWAIDPWGKTVTAGSNAEAILKAGQEPATNAQEAVGGATAATGTVSGLVRSFAGQVDQGDVDALVGGCTGAAVRAG